ncbi:MAG TPA: MarR family winged helix-turn-helix transcriptional regulator [Tepidisphaeraceae bacterium]|jgi:DNA-binding MarR family transcriptional regulator
MAAEPHNPKIDAIARDCIGRRVRTLGRVVTRIYDDALRPCGLTVGQLNILVAAAKMGLAQPAKVCKVLQMDASTLSRTIDRMKDNGWVEVVEGDDARAQPFRLTAAGRRMLDRAIPAWEAAQREARNLFGPEGEALLRKAAEALAKGPR